jgi:hypothetical protein
MKGGLSTAVFVKKSRENITEGLCLSLLVNLKPQLHTWKADIVHHRNWAGHCSNLQKLV